MVGDRDYPGLVRGNQAFVAALEAAGIEASLQVVPGAGHGFITAPEAEQMLAFFARHLK